jgi:hypothetical protein
LRAKRGNPSFTHPTPPANQANHQAEQNCFFEKKQQKTPAPTRSRRVIASEARQSIFHARYAPANPPPSAHRASQFMQRPVLPWQGFQQSTGDETGW